MTERKHGCQCTAARHIVRDNSRPINNHSLAGGATAVLLATKGRRPHQTPTNNQTVSVGHDQRRRQKGLLRTICPGSSNDLFSTNRQNSGLKDRDRRGGGRARVFWGPITSTNSHGLHHQLARQQTLSNGATLVLRPGRRGGTSALVYKIHRKKPPAHRTFARISVFRGEPLQRRHGKWCFAAVLITERQSKMSFDPRLPPT